MYLAGIVKFSEHVQATGLRNHGLEPTHGAWCLRSVLSNTVYTSTQVQVITKCLCDDLWVGVRCETHRFVRILVSHRVKMC